MYYHGPRWHGDIEIWDRDGTLLTSASALVPTEAMEVEMLRMAQLAAIFDGAWNPTGTVFAAALKSGTVALFSRKE